MVAQGAHGAVELLVAHVAGAYGLHLRLDDRHGALEVLELDARRDERRSLRALQARVRIVREARALAHVLVELRVGEAAQDAVRHREGGKARVAERDLRPQADRELALVDRHAVDHRASSLPLARGRHRGREAARRTAPKRRPEHGLHLGGEGVGLEVADRVQVDLGPRQDRVVDGGEVGGAQVDEVLDAPVARRGERRAGEHLLDQAVHRVLPLVVYDALDRVAEILLLLRHVVGAQARAVAGGGEHDVVQDGERLARELRPHAHVAWVRHLQAEGQELALAQLEDVCVEIGTVQRLEGGGEVARGRLASRAPAQDERHERRAAGVRCQGQLEEQPEGVHLELVGTKHPEVEASGQGVVRASNRSGYLPRAGA